MNAAEQPSYKVVRRECMFCGEEFELPCWTFDRHVCDDCLRGEKGEKMPLNAAAPDCRCEDCGEPFAAWRTGEITIKRVCRDCFKERQTRGRVAYKQMVGGAMIDLGKYPRLLRVLKEAASKEFRTPEGQALALLHQALGVEP